MSLYEPNWDSIQPQATELFYAGSLRLIFIRIPKTGSSSIRAVLENIGYKVDNNHFHQDYAMWKPYADPKTSLTFTVVRNPFDMLTSLFFDPGHPDRGEIGWRGIRVKDRDIMGIPRPSNYHTFESFVESWCSTTPPRYRDYILDPMWNRSLFTQLFPLNPYPYSNILKIYFPDDFPPDNIHIAPDEEYTPPNVVIRYEHLHAGLTKLLEKIGVKDIEIPHTNKTTDKTLLYQQYYTPHLRQLVETKHAADLEYLNYDFNGPTDTSIFVNPEQLIQMNQALNY